MVPRARRPTRRPLADESSPPVRRGAGKGRGEGRRPGVGTRRARACVCRARGGRGRPVGSVGRWSSAVGRRARRGVARKGGGVGSAGAAPRLPRRARPSAPLATRLPPRGDAVPTSRGGRPTPAPATPRTRERRGALPARLSPARPPRHVVPSRSGSEEEEGSGVWPGPASHARLRPRCRSRPTPFATAPHPARSLRCVSGLGGAAAARPPVAFPPPALGRFPAGRSWVLRSVPYAPSAGASFTCVPSPGTSPPSVVRPALSRSLSLFRALPPRCAPCPRSPPASRRSSPYALGGDKGCPGNAGAGRARAAGAGRLGFRSREGRVRARAWGRSPPGFGDTGVGASSGGGRGVSCGGRPGPPAGVPRHGPVAPRPPRVAGGRGRRSVSVGVGAAVSVGAPRAQPHPPRLARLPPLQVPSASRRGGLKTHGGSPVRLGVGAVGPAGSREAPPFSPRLRFTPPHHHRHLTTHGAGAPRRRGAAGPPRRGRREGATRRPWCGPGPCAARLRAPRPLCVRARARSGWGGAGGNPPGACGVSEPAPPAGSVPGAPW